MCRVVALAMTTVDGLVALVLVVILPQEWQQEKRGGVVPLLARIQCTQVSVHLGVGIYQSVLVKGPKPLWLLSKKILCNVQRGDRGERTHMK